MHARGLLLAVTASMACASSTPSSFSPSESTSAVAPSASAVPAVPFDRTLVGELVPLTSEHIRARPENPPGDEARVVALLAARLAQAGLEVKTAPLRDAAPDDGLAPGGDGRAVERRMNLLARLPGTRGAAGGGVILLGHSDVVPADLAEWTQPPYEGAVRGERLVGRGAIDMHAMLALETLTMAALAGLPAEERPAHDVYLLVAADEEVDGRGVQQALTDWPELKTAAWAINEGGFLLESYLRAGEDLAAIAVAEKGLLQFALEADGPSGHGSTPVEDAAPDRLVRAVARVLRHAGEAEFTWTRATERQLAEIGAARGGAQGLVLANPLLAELLAQSTLEATPSARALFRDTCALTVLDAGSKRNVIPARARAVFDCRLLPGTDPSAFRDEILAAMGDPRVTLTVLQAAAASGSDPDSRVVEVLRARVLQEAPRAVVAPVLTKGATDCRFVRAAGVPCYGFVPIRITRDELDAMHGKDEGVRVVELERGLARLVDVTHALAR